MDQTTLMNVVKHGVLTDFGWEEGIKERRENGWNFKLKQMDKKHCACANWNNI